jgi:ferritin-like metal-binding protein YciE
MKNREELMDWMRDAHAMECSMETSLDKHSNNEDLPQPFRERAKEHLEETRAHAEALRICLHQMGGDTSALKTGIAKGMETLRGLASAATRDEEVKDVLSSYAAEHFEIVCYTALRAAAEDLDETDVVALCDSILPDEERMAAWLLQYVPTLVSSYLAEQELASSI